VPNPHRKLRALLVAAAVGTATTVVAPVAATAHARPTAYELVGDADSTVGSKFEGIGTDDRRGLFYVSEVTGGEIHRGSVHSSRAAEWVAGDGTDGRFTARGITVDGEGRVYVAGGPNGLGTGRPDLWVYDASGRLLAALRAPGQDVFLNDVAIGADGAAYFTNSNDPQVFRVADDGAGWRATLWADATDRIERRPGFNLGGVVLTADRSALVVAQGNTGRLWRLDATTGEASAVETGGADLVDADGLLRQGGRLTVVRNVSRTVTTLRLAADGTRALLIEQEASAGGRVLTTAKALRGRILYVDSKFDEPVASGPYEVVTDPTR
jgi:sugar lactone lactonase YvrE